MGALANSAVQVSSNWYVFAAFGAGVISFLSPCVLPIVPGYLSLVTGLSVGEIQEAVEIPGPTLSHHLDILRRAGLLESRKEERYIYYSVQRERVTALVRLLTACC